MKQFTKTKYAETSSAKAIALANSPYFTDRISAITNHVVGEDVLSALVTDSCWKVRAEVAKKGYGLDTLVHDSEWRVREIVAQQGYGLVILVNDRRPNVRCAVARQGYGLDVLLHDQDIAVRAAVADMGYGLDTLINDPEWRVREVVASKGYKLDVLANDPDGYIRAAAKAYKNDPSLLGYVGVVDTKDCFTPEENNPYPLCVGQGKEECKDCQLRADWEPDDEHD